VCNHSNVLREKERTKDNETKESETEKETYKTTHRLNLFET